MLSDSKRSEILLLLEAALTALPVNLNNGVETPGYRANGGELAFREIQVCRSDIDKILSSAKMGMSKNVKRRQGIVVKANPACTNSMLILALDAAQKMLTLSWPDPDKDATTVERHQQTLKLIKAMLRENNDITPVVPAVSSNSDSQKPAFGSEISPRSFGSLVKKSRPPESK